MQFDSKLIPPGSHSNQSPRKNIWFWIVVIWAVGLSATALATVELHRYQQAKLRARFDAELQGVCQSETKTSGTPTTAERELLTRLRPLLKGSDLSSIEVLEELLALDIQRDPHWAALEYAVYALAFDRAAQLMEASLTENR